MEMRALVSCSAAGNGASDRFRLSNVSPWITSARGASGSDSPATVKLGSSSMIRAFKGVSIYKNKTRRNVLSQRNKQFRPMAYLGRKDLSSPDPTSFCDNDISEPQGTGSINGNDHSAVRVSQVDEFCKAHGGKRPIHSILVATNGMAAVKLIRSVRAWSYQTFGSEKSISLVAMATPEDMRINAEHIRIADQFMQVPGGTNNNNYANVHLIVEMAQATGVDAVWPGWGHASENPELPDALKAKGVIFLGPTAASMLALGDKIGSSLIAQAADVPTLPWSGSHVKIPPGSSMVTIPEEMYRQACVYTTEEAVASCQVVGYPAMIKASWGGGGKGIREVHDDDEVRTLFKQVQGEVPGSPIFIMKVASQSRHLEVQLLCDQYGNVSALHSRDCSVQRRHQKIIEEGPITVAPRDTVKKLEQAARRLAKSVNYVGAATVEFLYSMDTGDYFFLELNPRLQVEHPVTERIADINLPAAQVAVGMGIPLWQIPEIRRFYGIEQYDSWRTTSLLASPFDFDKAESVRPKGHCVAVRVTSEDPDDGFKPTSGQVQELSFKSNPNVWGYFSVKSGGGIHEFSDSQFGHVFAFGESRAMAISNMVLALKEIQIRGGVRTNVDYTIDLLHASDYRENKIHTGWLDSRIAMRVRADRPPWHLSVVSGTLYKASATGAAVVSDYIAYLDKGQIPPKHISLVHSQVSLNIEGSKYTVDVVRSGSGSYKLRMNNSEVAAEIHTLRDGGLLMQLDGKSHVIYAQEETSGTRLLIDGKTCLLQNEHDPSKLMAETPCKLVRYLVSDDSSIDADTPYAEVEVMKMCMPLLSPASGVIHFKMSEGQVMLPGELIANLDLTDPSTVRKAEPFHGRFPRLGLPTEISAKVHKRCAATLNAARMILAGYEHQVDEVVQDLVSCLDSPELPFLQWQECFAVLATRLPKDLRIMLESKYMEYECISRNSLTADFPAKLLKGILKAHVASCDENERGALERLIEPLMSLANSYEGGRESHACAIVRSLFEEYLSVEGLFNDNMLAHVIERMRQEYKKVDRSKIVDIVLSHQGLKSKNKLVLRLMEHFVYANPSVYRDKLVRFLTLNHTNYSDVVLKAIQLLEQRKLSELRSSILSELEMCAEDGENMDTPKSKCAMEDLVSAPLAVEDALVGLFDHSDRTLQRLVVETYIRRLYQPYVVKESVRMQWHQYGLIASWEFLDDLMERKTTDSDDDQETCEKVFVEKRRKKKKGFMVIIKSLEFLPNIISAALTETNHSDYESPLSGNIMHIAIVGMSLLQDRYLTQACDVFKLSENEEQAQGRVDKVLKEEEVSSRLRSAGVGVVSCIIQRDEEQTPIRHSFHWSMEKQYYAEEPMLRHLEPPLSIYLELDKLRGYENIQYTPTRDRQWHLYTVTDNKPVPVRRMFLRSLVRQGQDNQLSLTLVRSLRDAMEELELNAHKEDAMKPDHAHMFLCLSREQQINDLMPYPRRVDVNAAEVEETTMEMMLEETVGEIHKSAGVRMHRLGVCEWEVRLRLASSGVASGAWRAVVTNVTGRTCTVHIYREVEATGGNSLIYQSITKKGPLHGTPINDQYKPLGHLDRQRLAARRSNTTYCYDFPLAFETALEELWESQHPGVKKLYKNTLINVEELVLSTPEGSLIPVKRLPGLNDCGMVAWTLEMSTPEFPKGRKIIIVANDVTFKAGSFGPREDAFFLAVTELACAEKLPLIYLAANSGARLGVAEEVKACFKVGWSDEVSPENGFQYIYLSPEDHARIGSSVIAHEIKLPSGEKRWVIDTIVGQEDGIGVENLTGSGAIAGAYSRAYKETFTLTFVSGRTVGIGAYLGRLGMRCIQRLDQPIILTGFSTLNKLLGREVYSSHMQLGGPKIMGANGVVHRTVSDDLEGVSAILNWLSYVPAHAGGPLPLLAPLDPPERTVEYVPQNSCDPRAAIAGVNDKAGKWLGGIFDKNSFIETLEGWARTVVTGRAKLGGVPVGVVAVETQTVTQIIPADPGQVDSHERVVPQAGQVWFPGSAAKTAQALMDFNREGLPLFILANWRGFSGGQRDLFEGILQAGSAIVESLRTYGQPVFVYIPKMGELRGGAWVVVDSQINSDYVEMYADETSRGNVLEPEGMIEIKFRKREMLECMGRLDQNLISLRAKLQDAKQSEMDLIKQQIKARKKQLLPLYIQIATKFADLHDTSMRMAAKGVIKCVVDWSGSRSFFYRKLIRRIAESSLVKHVREASGDNLSYKSAMGLIKDWFCKSDVAKGKEEAWTDDQVFFTWKDNVGNYESELSELRARKLLNQLAEIGNSSDLQALPQGLANILHKVEPLKRKELVDALRKVLS
uniref:Acetyl-CoA carboxylase n=1 Tax=Brassica napus TaxID=3708 RepID=Q9FNT7_BRANA|nr:acetyl-CoA carboxylase [Brassica napus]